MKDSIPTEIGLNTLLYIRVVKQTFSCVRGEKPRFLYCSGSQKPGCLKYPDCKWNGV